jgi:integration host factor subunit beta
LFGFEIIVGRKTGDFSCKSKVFRGLSIDCQGQLGAAVLYDRASGVMMSWGYHFVDHGTKGWIMIRSELVQNLGKTFVGLSQREVDRIVDLFFDTIVTHLATGGRVELRGFGAFSTRARDGRTGRNPRTGETVAIDSKRVPYFKPGKEIRLNLNAG